MIVLSPRARLAIWAVFICACVVPWTDPQNHSHWSRVQWIPFVTPPVKPADAIVNVLLYVPFGYWIVILSPDRATWRRAVACAFVLSIATEWTQLYSHSRFPSMTDVTCNIIGAALGAWRAKARANSVAGLARHMHERANVRYLL